ncbi:Pyoverdine/dityrosine biosynthesis protein-domain-containing protein [Boeremia exigua]|uniref:Pyoverdine/dityrosine biosynthesis protein-domain-containing protein n=1 Tax=Boeremia exigua TaxID=749465 RepID=UPI001E8DD4A5|nr:Pyoverdine/dityrosine biosynthesis protein-domain-containing protein [Boeremia exigua]KAH6622477.1 Pyoverdine/dityrosine biosynthesis protein-domain-containing protein [Boeremia exigua]
MLSVTPTAAHDPAFLRPDLKNGTLRNDRPSDSEEVLNKQGFKVDEIVTAIMKILEKFSLQQHGNDVFMGKEVFSPRVHRHVSAGRRIPMVLPAFPAKSINVQDKVLGSSPDLGEELALDRLNDLCTQIGQVYEPGATVLVATDGACYNDLTGVTPDDLWEYGSALRKLVAQKGYHCIEFVRIMNLVGLHTGEQISKDEFTRLLEPSRLELMSQYGDSDFDANYYIQNDPDYKSTYDGYAKFLKKDLAFSPLRKSISSGKKWKCLVHNTAKAMIARGVAFAALILEKYPEYVRLSIHPSTGLTKISMPLIPQPDSFSMTPWHCAVAVDVYGKFRTGHAATLRENYDLVTKDGRPYCFRERSALYSWDAEVEFSHLYGGGLIVRNRGAHKEVSFSETDLKKMAALTRMQGKVILEGFGKLASDIVDIK